MPAVRTPSNTKPSLGTLSGLYQPSDWAVTTISSETTLSGLFQPSNWAVTTISSETILSGLYQPSDWALSTIRLGSINHQQPSASDRLGFIDLMLWAPSLCSINHQTGLYQPSDCTASSAQQLALHPVQLLACPGSDFATTAGKQQLSTESTEASSSCLLSLLRQAAAVY